jgi:hypothetical protein
VANRRYLDQQLFQQLDQHSKFGTPFGIMLADLDELKKINDTHGHVAGDAALVTVAKTLSGCLRASDVLGRWGGRRILGDSPRHYERHPGGHVREMQGSGRSVYSTGGRLTDPGDHLCGGCHERSWGFGGIPHEQGRSAPVSQQAVRPKPRNLVTKIGL